MIVADLEIAIASPSFASLLEKVILDKAVRLRNEKCVLGVTRGRAV